MARSRKRKSTGQLIMQNNGAISTTQCDYYNQKGEVVKITLKQGSVLDQPADAIAVTINKRLAHTSGLMRNLSIVAGDFLYKDSVDRAKQFFAQDNGRKHERGDVVPVDMQMFQICPWRWVFLVVEPTMSSMSTVFDKVLELCSKNRVTSLVTVGIGCGELGVRPIDCAENLFSSLFRNDIAGEIAHLKNLHVYDLQADVIAGFTQILQKLGDDQVNQPNMSRFCTPAACVANGSAAQEGDGPDEIAARKFVRPIAEDEVEKSECVFCLEELKAEGIPVCALSCKHQFHFPCFVGYIKQSKTCKSCPICRKYFDVPCGNQPIGSSMHVRVIAGVLEGFEEDSKNIIEITYQLPSGVQNETHPRPGQPFRGTTRVAYLPDSEDGNKVLALLRKAFELRLTFTVGDSVTTGARDVVVWNNIHHKTNTHGGAQYFGYPDPTYLVRVTGELSDAGVTEELLNA